MSKIRVLIADDHAIVREGICSLLGHRKDIEVVGQAADGKQAIEQATAVLPDVVLMDISMPVMNGLEATREIRKSLPGIRILVLSQYESKEYVIPLLRAGAAGYIAKRARANELTDAIRAVYFEGAFLPPNIARAVVEGAAAASGEAARHAMLTEREIEVVRLVADGLSSREIAEHLCLSVRTVDTHRSNILEKIGAHSVAELIKYAIREGIVEA
jgi:two-component system, NarL family, response regulator NreC